MTSPVDAHPLPLAGVVVLDLTQVMAGPFCTMLLGDLGADVIKIEPPGSGDLSRSMGGAQLALRGDDNAPFLALNRNKRSVVLDLKSAGDAESLRALARTADVFVENSRPGVMARLGVDYDALAPINPRLIYASISGFGDTGPYADRPGFDLVAQGMSGVMSVTGEPDRPPVKCGVPISDLSAGLFAANGIMAALIARERTGRGQRVETSLFESALAMSAWESAEYWATGAAPRPKGSAHRLSAPYQAFRARDGYLTIAALTPRQWERLCGVLGREMLATDSRFATNDARMANAAALATEIESALAVAGVTEWVERLLEAGVPAGPILDYAQVFADPHTTARNMIWKIVHPVEGTIRVLGCPVKLSGAQPAARRPPPRLGEHTREVLATLDAGDRRAAGRRESTP
jgi:formyl-CoA transferase